MRLCLPAARQWREGGDGEKADAGCLPKMTPQLSPLQKLRQHVDVAAVPERAVEWCAERRRQALHHLHFAQNVFLLVACSGVCFGYHLQGKEARVVFVFRGVQPGNGHKIYASETTDAKDPVHQHQGVAGQRLGVRGEGECACAGGRGEVVHAIGVNHHPSRQCAPRT